MRLQVARSIRIVLNNGQAHVEVQLDADTINKLQVGSSVSSVCAGRQVAQQATWLTRAACQLRGR